VLFDQELFFCKNKNKKEGLSAPSSWLALLLRGHTGRN